MGAKQKGRNRRKRNVGFGALTGFGKEKPREAF
jgi:hypothetical protein